MSNSPKQSQNITQFNRFLLNNNQMLQFKYQQHFKLDQIKITSTQPKIQTIVNFIADVFSFEDSNNQQSMIVIRDSLKISYQGYIASNQNVKEFNFHIAIQLLKFCIESNQMFAVQYQNNKDIFQNKANIVGDKIRQQNNHIQEKQSILSVEMQNNKINHVKVDSLNMKMNQNQNSNSNYNSNSNQFTNTNINPGPLPPPLITQKRKKNTFDDSSLENEFNFQEEIKISLDPILLKKNIKIVFDFYCKQQMSLSPNLSFDRIERQSHMMTISKMLLMARMMNMINVTLTKKVLIGKFRAISEGKRQMDYKKFDIFINQIQILDPSMIARAQLNCPQIQNYLKTTKKAFDTQDLLPRELIKNRQFANKVTAHSGKMVADLMQDLRHKKSQSVQFEENDKNIDQTPLIISSRIKKYSQEITIKIKQRYNKQKSIPHQDSHMKEPQSSILRRQSQIISTKNQPQSSILRRQSQIISTKNLIKQRNYSHDLSGLKIRKFIETDHEDEKWLGQYRISSIRRAKAYDLSPDKKRSFQDKDKNSMLIQSIKRRVKQIQKTQNSSHSNGLDQTKPYIFSSRRV